MTLLGRTWLFPPFKEHETPLTEDTHIFFQTVRTVFVILFLKKKKRISKSLFTR